MFLEDSFKAVLFGVTVAAAVGPIALLIIGYGATAGFRPAARAGLGAALADLSYALLAFSTGALALPWLTAQSPLARAVPALILLAFAGRMLARAAHPVTAATAPPGLRWPLLSTYALTLANPMTLIVFAGFAGQLPLVDSTPTIVWFSLCLFTGSLGVQCIFAAAGGALTRCPQQARWRHALNIASTLGIAGFGVIGLLEATRTL